jgi:hypothetical protein
MDLPSDIKIRAILTQGGAFKGKLGKDSYPRFYFVLNINPESDKVLILSTSTTAFELHRSCPGGDEVHIPVGPRDYGSFTQDCLICCNRPYLIEKELLRKKLNSQGYEILPQLTPSVLGKILSGIAKSPVVAPAVKKLVLQNYFGD